MSNSDVAESDGRSSEENKEEQHTSSVNEHSSKNASQVKKTKKSQMTDLRKYSTEQIKVMKPSKNIDNSFKNMKISDASFLNDLDGRSACSVCGKSRKYFCYTCHIPLANIADKIPKIRLPCKVDVIKHPREIDGKSTAVHAAVIAPEDVQIYTYPDIPDYSNEGDVLLIFPDKEAIRLEDLWTCLEKQTHRQSQEPEVKRTKPQLPFTRALFIDCTWNQTRKIYNDERVQGLQCVELTSRDTLFWRYQRGKPKTYLATIEAIYYFIIDVHTHVLKQEYHHEYDDLLFFFKYMFEKIHSIYDKDTLRAYKDV
ncbi:tRNA-uridine aminocarboxypropyltransferase 1 [Penaeus vannamei]|uniref:tRNA-uridine aminocarboxypropyltransferase 1 n=1 Tax=Penaeus vannamei TaxID=6689 RepID=UPI000F67C4DE|nr:DTW domain-containing protein 1-like [Penaeus vannamei]XP_027227662.1 DTW domain-containing protein 1-like [Penaeus vannamei]